MHFLFQPLSTFFLTSGVDIDGLTDVSGSVVELSEAIDKYGIAVVVMAVFFIIFIILILIMLRSNTKMMDKIINDNNKSNTLDQELINKFVDNALDAKTRDDKKIIDTLSHELKDSLQPIKQAVNDMNQENHYHKENDYHKDLVGAYIDINMAFKDISRSTLTELKCDRIGIYIFHNGNKSMHGLPFFKMSCIHEWTSHGTMTLRGKSHMDMPLHLFNDFIENLWRSGLYKSENVETSVLEDPSIKEFMAFSPAKSLYLVAIKDENDSLSGFIAAEFLDIDTFEHDEERSNHVKGIIDRMIQKIAPIVTHKYIYRNPEC